MSEATLSIGGIAVPRFLYGTAWKEEATGALVERAIAAGFRGIDTANQRRHYDEASVGEAIAAAIERGTVARDELFLQTKFTFRGGQDHRLPYDPAAPVARQVEQSLTSSLDHLRVRAIDSYVLHGPSQSRGLGPADWEAWRAMEAACESGRTRLLGISNVDAEQLQQLCEGAKIRPAFVQNRCFARTRWDRQVRTICAAIAIRYQGFSLLTANLEVLKHPVVAKIADRYEKTPQQIVFRFALDVGMIPLTGTTSEQHMRDDLEVFAFRLEREEVQRIENLVNA